MLRAFLYGSGGEQHDDFSAPPQDGRLDIKLRRLNSADLLVFPDTAQVCTRSWICKDSAAHMPPFVAFSFSFLTIDID